MENLFTKHEQDKLIKKAAKNKKYNQRLKGIRADIDAIIESNRTKSVQLSEILAEIKKYDNRSNRQKKA